MLSPSPLSPLLSTIIMMASYRFDTEVGYCLLLRRPFRIYKLILYNFWINRKINCTKKNVYSQFNGCVDSWQTRRTSRTYRLRCLLLCFLSKSFYCITVVHFNFAIVRPSLFDTFLGGGVEKIALRSIFYSLHVWAVLWLFACTFLCRCYVSCCYWLYWHKLTITLKTVSVAFRIHIVSLPNNTVLNPRITTATNNS